MAVKKRAKKASRAKVAAVVVMAPEPRFRVVKSFHSQEFASDYAAGMTYTVRAGNDKLGRLAKRWAIDGLVEFVTEAAVQPASAKGRGKVK